jgi:hypothetical protein
MTVPELAKFLANQKWRPHGPQARTCNGGKACKAQLSAIEGQQEIAPVDADGNGYGTVVVRMQNLGSATQVEDVYKIKGGTFRYYMIAHTASPTSMTWTLHEVPQGKQARKVAHGSWTGCPKYDHASTRPAEAMFTTCQKAHAIGDTAKGSGKNFDDPIDPTWMTCSDGCCTAGNPIF